MPIYDYECSKDCDEMNIDVIVGVEDDYYMEGCGHLGKRLLSLSNTSVNISNQDAGWISDLHTGPGSTMDRDNPDPAVKAFLKDRTRSNMKGAMDAQGIRFMEDGEMDPSTMRRKRKKDGEALERQLTKAVVKSHFDRKKITIRGNKDGKF